MSIVRSSTDDLECCHGAVAKSLAHWPANGMRTCTLSPASTAGVN